MIRLPFKISAAAAMILASCTIALAQSQNPACQRLEGQLTALDRGNEDPARADQIRRAEDAVNRQQFEVDRLVLQARRAGCENSGFFSIFTSAPHQCGGINRTIDAQRSNLERMRNALEQLQGGTTERAARRQALLIALGDNGCGPQYRSAALAGQQGGFFDRLFGGNNSLPGSSGPMGGTYRTICVRTCDGYYFPISYEASSDRFRDDEQTCQHMCPAAEVSLYTYHNPGEDVAQAVSLNGRLYTELPTAFQYRKALNPACSCRRPGESWAEALRAVGPDQTLAPGDVVVTDKKAKQLSQPRNGPALKGSVEEKPTAKPAEKPMVDAPGEIDPAKRKVRTVGPSFLPKQ
jgi:Protein of unknown function (DUF2865)